VKPLFFDTMVLSHSARADRLDVLRDLLVERQCWTTVVVRRELELGAQLHPAIRSALTLDWMQAVNLDELDDLKCFIKWAERLGSRERDLGEVSILAAAELRRGTAVTDDRDATGVARRHGADVHGTIWLLAAACRETRLTTVAAGSIVEALARRARGCRARATSSRSSPPSTGCCHVP
jgi:predicted nucleic acid-binding protein